MNSNRKGKEGERELANLLKDRYGYDCRRGQQFCGSNGDADVVGLPGIHIECKRVEKLNIYEAVEQSISDCKASRKNREQCCANHGRKACRSKLSVSESR